MESNWHSETTSGVTAVASAGTILKITQLSLNCSAFMFRSNKIKIYQTVHRQELACNATDGYETVQVCDRSSSEVRDLA